MILVNSMRSDTYPPQAAPQQTRQGTKRVFAAAAALLLVAVILLIVSVVQSRRSPASLHENGFLPAQGEGVFYAGAGNGLAVASHDSARLYSGSRKCVASTKLEYRIPVCVGCPVMGVYYDMNSPGITALYPDGSCRTAETAGAVVFADVNETGLVTVLLEETSTLGTVEVYDTDLTPLFRWEAGTGFPVSVRSAADDRLCVNCVSRDGTTLHFFRIDSVEEQGSFVLSDELIMDFGFLKDGTLAAVTEDRLILLDPAGELISSHVFEESHLEAYSFDGDFIAVVTASGFSGGTGVLTTLDSRGQLLESLSVSRQIQCLSAQDDALLVLYTGEESTLYDRLLREQVSYQPEASVEKIFLTPDGAAYYAGPEGVTQIDFSR